MEKAGSSCKASENVVVVHLGVRWVFPKLINNSWSLNEGNCNREDDKSQDYG